VSWGGERASTSQAPPAERSEGRRRVRSEAGAR